MNAILFLAPVSAFDEVLEEDPKVSRLEDSMLLFREICRNKLLVNVDLILFLNKIDLLQKKLESGIQLNKYYAQYKGQNTVDDVCTCEWSFLLAANRTQVHGRGFELTHFYLVDFEKKFVATHREGLKAIHAEMQDPAKNAGKAQKLPDKQRLLKVHRTSVIDTDSTKDIIYEGVLLEFVFGG